MSRLSLVSFFVILMTGAVIAQGTPPGPGPGPPGGPLPCELVHGGFDIVAATPDSIEGTLTGDLEGTFSLTVTEFREHTLPFGTVLRYRFEGTITTAGGTLETTGRLLSVNLMAPPPMPPPPGGPPGPLPMLTIQRIGFRVLGGTGEYEDHIGRIHGMAVSTPMPGGPGFAHYHGILCVPPVPAPKP